MKLITEQIYSEDLDLIKEDKNGNMTYKIKGPFVQSNKLNKNKRIYPKELIEREIKRYNLEEISQKSSVGELSHPNGPEINPERISHLVESLDLVGNDGIGVAKVLTDFPMGKIVKGMLDEGIKFGVSSRGIGTLNGNRVSDDYRMICIDIVMTPSGPDCYVNGILENAEYIMEGNKIVEVAVDKMKKTLDKQGSKDIYNTLNQFLNDIRNG